MYTDQNAPHAGSAEVMFTSMFSEPAGTLARTMNRDNIVSGTLAPASGVVSACILPLPAGLPVRNLAILTGATAAVAPSHFWLAVADAGLNVLAITADQGAAAIAAQQQYVLPVTVPAVVPQTGVWYALCSISAVTTMPTLAGRSSLATGVSGLAPAYCGTAGTLAAPPAPGQQVNGGVITATAALAYAFWVS